MSAGSYGTFDGGGRDQSDDARDGVHGRAGEPRVELVVGMYGGASEGGGMVGASSRIDDGRLRGSELVDEWYDLKLGEVLLLLNGKSLYASG